MPIIPPEVYRTWRRFIPYSVWSSRIIDIYNSAVKIKSSIRFATREYATAHEAEYRTHIKFWRDSLHLVCGAIRRSRWEWIYVDIGDIRRAELRTWLPFIIEEGTPFEIVCDQTDALFDDCLKELEEKIVVVVEEYIGVNVDGNDIYFDLKTKEYVLRHYRTKEEITRTTYLEVDETLSVETEKGHAVPFVAEITSSTRIKEMGRAEIDTLESDTQTRIDDFFHKKPGFDKIKSGALKIGVEYRLPPRVVTDYPSTEFVIEKTKPEREKRKYPSETVRI